MNIMSAMYLNHKPKPRFGQVFINPEGNEGHKILITYRLPGERADVITQLDDSSSPLGGPNLAEGNPALQELARRLTELAGMVWQVKQPADDSAELTEITQVMGRVIDTLNLPEAEKAGLRSDIAQGAVPYFNMIQFKTRGT